MARVLAIGDVHAPADHPGYLPFCRDLCRKHRCNKVVFLGDVADFHAVSFHAANPQCPGPDDEYLLAKQAIKRWYRVFPKAKVCIGNHDERVIRLAESVNIPARFLRDYRDVWSTPGWDWQHEHVIDDVYYFHGTAQGGTHPAWNAVGKMLMSVVMGHCHSRSGVKWRANPAKRLFALDVGCGINVDAFQFAYGKHMKERPILSAAVIINGVPHHAVMPCGTGEKYHKSRFKGVK